MDKAKFENIKSEYDNFYNELLRNGKLPLWDTGRGFYGNAISGEIFDADVE